MNLISLVPDINGIEFVVGSTEGSFTYYGVTPSMNSSLTGFNCAGARIRISGSESIESGSRLNSNLPRRQYVFTLTLNILARTWMYSELHRLHLLNQRLILSSWMQ